VLIGSSYRLIDAKSNVIETIVKPMDHEELAWIFHTRTALEHGSVTYRYKMAGAEPIYYNEKYRTAQDFDFWLRNLKLGRGAVSKEIYLDYRVHDANVTSTLSTQQIKNLIDTAVNFLKAEYILSTDEIENTETLINLLNGTGSFTIPDFGKSLLIMRILIEKYLAKTNLNNTSASFMRRRAHSQLWFAAMFKRKSSLVSKLFLPIFFPASFSMVLTRLVYREKFLKT
jgi:hypothetical protein